MMSLILSAELLLLYFLSAAVSRALYRFFTLLFRTRPIAVSLLLAIQFPGTVIHELAHLFTAEILGVQTGKLRLEPESIREESIQAGSVMIAETDPVRRALIGLAPLFWGMTALAALSYFIPTLYESVFAFGLPLWENRDFYLLFGVGYLLYAVSNTMFPSPVDMQGVTPILIALVGISVLGGVLGVQIPISIAVAEVVSQLILTLTKSLGVVLGLNIVLLSLAHLLIIWFSRLLRVRVTN